MLYTLYRVRNCFEFYLVPIPSCFLFGCALGLREPSGLCDE